MEIELLKLLAARLRTKVTELRRAPADAGYTTETVIVTALLVALCIAAMAIIAAKVKNKANVLDLG
jgi:hypothetical protein